MRPTLAEIRARWEQDGEKGFVPLLCLPYNKERFVSLSLSAELVWKGTESVSVCGYSPIVSPGVCLWAQTVPCSLWYSTETQAQRITRKATRYLRETSSLFDLLSGNGSILSAVVYGDQSLRLGLGWKRAFRQKVNVCSKCNYWQWWKVTNNKIEYWRDTFLVMLL